MSKAYVCCFKAGIAALALGVSAVLGSSAGCAESPAATPRVSVVPALESFLDRLMLAESGGRDHIRNPRSTAFGAFQFIDQTFMELVRRHFAGETGALTQAQVLALRADRAFARRVAAAFTEENGQFLVANGLAPSWPNLRLAFFAGPVGAVRILKSQANATVLSVLGPQVVRANPFLARMTAADLAAWSAHSIAGRRGVPLPSQVVLAAVSVIPAEPGTAHKAALPPVRLAVATRRQRSRQAPVVAGAVASLAGLAGVPAAPDAKAARPTRVAPPCNMGLASCRHWVALAERRQVRQRQAALRRDLPAQSTGRR